jgi:hypothetical protein
MSNDSFDRRQEFRMIVLVEREELDLAERFVASCEACDVEAELSFASILDSLKGSNPATTDYLFEMPAKCPRCRSDILEITLVKPIV